MRRLLKHDSMTGISTYFHDLGNDEYAVETEQDITELLEENKANYAATDEHATWGEGRIVARIPMSVMIDLQREGKLDREGYAVDDKEILKMLNDRDYLKFRTRPGRLI